MEVEDWPLRKEELISQHSGAIVSAETIQLSLKVFASGKVMATFDSNGETHIYTRGERHWTYRGCAKLYPQSHADSTVPSLAATLRNTWVGTTSPWLAIMAQSKFAP
jgi:hypothetical protein